MEKNSVSITLDKSQIILDICAECGLLARTMQAQFDGKAETPSAISVSTLASYIQTPLDENVKPLLARALTESFNNLRSLAQRFLAFGRSSDTNNLETVEGSFVMELVMSKYFNLAVVPTITSQMHRFIVDSCMAHILRSQAPEIASRYATSIDNASSRIVKALNARYDFSRTHQDWE